MNNYQQLIITEPAANFRALARQGLQGRWGDGFVKGLIFLLARSLPVQIILALAGWLGLPGDNMNKFTEAYVDFILGYISQAQFESVMAASMSGLVPLTFLYQLIVTGALMFGIVSVYLRYRRRQEAPTDMLFSGFSQFSRALALYLLMYIFIMLWSLLLIIPGIVAFYRYRLAFFILVDNPDVGPLEAISISKGLMYGNKWKLFCLDISFIGWAILSAIAASIISIPFTMPFTTASTSYDVSYNVGEGLIYAVVLSAVASAAMGLLYAYHGTAVAAFYERTSGLLKYTDEVRSAP